MLCHNDTNRSYVLYFRMAIIAFYHQLFFTKAHWQRIDFTNFRTTMSFVVYSVKLGNFYDNTQ